LCRLRPQRATQGEHRTAEEKRWSVPAVCGLVRPC
jgi:hypothetical protein